jgi:hypothetical protein
MRPRDANIGIDSIFYHSLCGEVLPMDADCFREWARIMDRKPDRFVEDAMIGHGAILAN